MPTNLRRRCGRGSLAARPDHRSCNLVDMFAPFTGRRLARPGGIAWWAGVLAAALCIVVEAGLAPVTPGAPASGAVEPPVWHKPIRGPALMVVGDSISQGSAGDFTWRYRLYRQLVATGERPEMVGPRNDLFDNVNERQGDLDYADPAFDTDHDAVWGRLLTSAADTIAGEVAAARADYLLVLVGINDLIGTSGAIGAEVGLRRFLANARIGSARVKIVLGTLLPTARSLTDRDFAGRIADYNSRLIRVAAELSTDASPIVVADTGRDMDVAADLYDGTHPNARGEYKIAAAFADALASRFGLGRPFSQPLPDVPVGPRTAPELAGEAGAGTAMLSWTASPGATAYWLWQRVAGDATFSRVPMSLSPGQRQWTSARLNRRVAYEFEVQPVKVEDGGAMSNIIRITPT
jgi:lysophospholipase L1-like esterase